MTNYSTESTLLDEDSPQIQLRAMAPRDVEATKQIEMAWASLSHWDIEVYRRVATGADSAQGMIAVEVAAAKEERVVGFLVYRTTHPETEILNIAIEPSMVRRQIGTMMLHELIQQIRFRDVRALLLEVRPSNDPARRFYLKEGFVEVGRRRNYYTNPPEDAVLMKRELT